MSMFDWVTLDNGRACFSGGGPCWDGKVRNVFALDLGDGDIRFGEFATKYNDDQQHFNVEIKNFGYDNKYDVGAPDGRLAYSSISIEKIRALICDLIVNGVPGEGKPFPLHKPERFLGGVEFSDGWVVEA